MSIVQPYIYVESSNSDISGIYYLNNSTPYYINNNTNYINNGNANIILNLVDIAGTLYWIFYNITTQITRKNTSGSPNPLDIVITNNYIGQSWENSPITTMNIISLYLDATQTILTAFNNTGNIIQDFILPQSINSNNVTEIDANVFDSQTMNSLLPYFITTINSNAFYQATISIIDLPAIQTIHLEAFTLANITALTLSSLLSSVITIEDYAFNSCNINMLNIDSNTTTLTIGTSAFWANGGPINISNLNISSTSITVVPTPGSPSPGSTQYLFESCSNVNFSCNYLTSIGDNVFHFANFANNLTLNNVIAVGNSAFEQCIPLTSITFDNSLTTIAASAFQGCTGLTSIIIPKLVTTIATNAFADSLNLDTIIFIGNGSQNISNSIFQNISSTATIYINPFDTTWAGMAFYTNAFQSNYVTIDNSYISIPYNNIQYNSTTNISITPINFSGLYSINILSNVSYGTLTDQTTGQIITTFPHILTGNIITYNNLYNLNITSDQFQCYILNTALPQIEYQEITLNLSQPPPSPSPIPYISICSDCPKPVFYKAIQHLDIMGSDNTRNMQFSKQIQLGRGKTQFISQNTNVVSKNPNPNNSSR